MWPHQPGESAQKKRKREADGVDLVLQHYQSAGNSSLGGKSIVPFGAGGNGESTSQNALGLQPNSSHCSWDATHLSQGQQVATQHHTASSNLYNLPMDGYPMIHYGAQAPPIFPSSALYNWPLPQYPTTWAAQSLGVAGSVSASGAVATVVQEAVPEIFQYSVERNTDKNVEQEAETMSSQLGIDPDETVCFGVIGGIVGKCERPLSTSSGVVEAAIVSASNFSLKSTPDVRGHIASDHSFLLRDLLHSGVELRVNCNFERAGRDKQDASKPRKYVPCQLGIAIYGPFAMLQEIKEWSEDNDEYLQDPTFCLQDARYCNPQRLSLYFDAPRMVSEVLPEVSEHRMRLRSITDNDDFLDKYMASKIELLETEQPSAIKTALKSHQKQALTFMLRREMGWALDRPMKDMWSILDNAKGRFYINAVSESGSKQPPPAFCGGIIADPMGLGKTLTMIALAATDLTKSAEDKATVVIEALDGGAKPVAATLIIVPPPLLRVWENQMSEHIFNGALKFRRHHAKFRVATMNDIAGVDIVLTTYHTVSAEWSETGKSSSMLFSVKWKRIVLDEAHVIRNESSRMSKAMCSLDAECRWAVTGTPIQNHLNDLASLLKFIRAHPYESRKQFEADISEYWKDGKAQEAAGRLQRLSSCLFLRRPKSTIKLPPRYNKEYPVDFTPREREEYELIKNRTISAIGDALQQGHGSHRSGAYANILQQIESMRLFCDLGVHYHIRHDTRSISSHNTISWGSIAQKTFKLHLEQSALQCSQCQAIIDLTQTMLDDSTAGFPLFSRCLKFVCAECATRLAKRRLNIPCGHTPSCPAAQVSTSIDAMDHVADNQTTTAALPGQMPSKIVALISDLKAQPAHVKSVVFSSWRLTLNVVAAGLGQAGIQYLRFDGSIRQKDRHSILESFTKDHQKRVLLLTFSCGAVGLTLTEASRAYLLEPHWNPTIEEQALGRIYRIGQDKEITTVRLFVRDSIETHVMNIQQSKKDLAQVILAPHDGGMVDTTLKKLQKLRSLL